MRREQLITLLARPKFGWPQDVRVQPSRVRPLVALIGATCMLLSPCYGQQQVAQGADAASAQLVFNNACRTCHTTKEDDNRLGPHLDKVIGRKAGSLPDYGYSSAMKGADFVWDEEKLERFIANPDELVPGNNMKPYSGLASPDDRTKVIAFLKSVRAGQ